MFWVISVYFNIRNTLPKSGTFLLGHSVYDVTGINVNGRYITEVMMVWGVPRFVEVENCASYNVDTVITNLEYTGRRSINVIFTKK